MPVVMPASPTRCCVRCGHPLDPGHPLGPGRLDRPGRARCPACERRPGEAPGPPAVEPEFWLTDRMGRACASRHLGRVSVAYRTHPAHGRRISQECLAGWLGLRQAQVSLTESGPPVRDLDRLIHWARTLRIPEWLLWFDLPGRRRRPPAGRLAVAPEGIATPVDPRALDDLLAVPRHGIADAPPPPPPPLELAAGGTSTGRGSALLLVDGEVISRVETVLAAAQRQDDTLGPRAALETVLAQRRLLRGVLPRCAPALRPRLLSTYADATRAAGWLSFDLRNFAAAAYYYDEARGAAHEARDTPLGALIRCQLGLLAIWRGRPRLGAERAADARAWADRTDDRALRAFARDIGARAHAASDEPTACLAALDDAERLLSGADPRGSLAYFHNSSLLAAVRGRCLVDLGAPGAGRDAIVASLMTMDRRFVRNVAFTHLDLALAHLGAGDVDAAADSVGQARRLATRNHSARLAVALRETRGRLEPWRDTSAVRALDRADA
jgi:hypothetical protein